MSGPNHHEEMEAHYAAGMERQEEQFLIEEAVAAAKAKVDEEIEREGHPPSAMALVSIAVAASVKTVTRSCEEIDRLRQPRPLDEWHEEDGNVLWWRFPIDEPPYCGSPLDVGRTIRIIIDGVVGGPEGENYQVGGWPGYHTHWTPIPEVREP